MAEKKDVFICHASEDKEDVIRPLVNALAEAGITYWLDETEIKWGDTLTKEVNKGLKISRYVIVVLSCSFTAKHWPERELYAVLNIEATSGEVKVLPLLVGTQDERENILKEYPLISDKRYLTWDNNLEEIVEALHKRLSRTKAKGLFEAKPAADLRKNFDIPLPIIKKTFTQRDKDKYLHDSFEFIKSYFREALSRLESHANDIETNFTEIHNFKFLCTVYVRGNIGNKCKIWIGGPYSSDTTIAYSESNVDIENDSSYNDWFSVKDDGTQLGFEPSPLSFSGHNYSRKSILNKDDAAKHLWKRFTQYLS